MNKLYEKLYNYDKAEFNKLKISLGYDLGGVNIFNGSRSARGYYVYFQPIKLEVHTLSNGDKYTTHQARLLDPDKSISGFKVLILSVNRKSNKSADQAVNKIEKLSDRVADLFKQGKYLEVNDLLSV